MSGWLGGVDPGVTWTLGPCASWVLCPLGPEVSGVTWPLGPYAPQDLHLRGEGGKVVGCYGLPMTEGLWWFAAGVCATIVILGALFLIFLWKWGQDWYG